MACFVLIHGAFRGGWSWDRVVPILRAAGHRAFAPSLTGAGENVDKLSPEITLSVWARDIASLLELENLNEVILVGHSQGGIVAQATAEIVPESISRIVFLDSPVLQNGEAAIDIFPAGILDKFGEPEKNTLIQPVPVAVSDDFSPDDVAWINERLTAVPTNPGFDKIRVDRSATIPHTYIFCSKTPPFYPSSFSRARFDTENVQYILIDAPHDCMLSHPQLVAETLAAAV
jgi:pimeloyl-ACP methyl ester carboxylesterase